MWFRFCVAISIALLSIAIHLAISDGRYILDPLNRFIFPLSQSVVVTGEEHVAWRNITRNAVDLIRAELQAWEQSASNSFPEFTSLTPIQYFPEVDAETHGKDQKRAWGFLWLRLYGIDTKLSSEFPQLMSLYDSLNVEIYSVGISVLQPGRGDVSHLGEFRGTWRQLLTIEEPTHGAIRLGLYPYASGKGRDFSRLCDSIWTSQEIFQEQCQPNMDPPLVHEYRTGKDILFDDSIWHFIDNDATEGRRVAIWADVVRTDLNLWQRIFLRIFMFLATNLNDEVTDIVKLVDQFDYTKKEGVDDGRTLSLDDAPKGPIESYDRNNIIDVDVGFD